MDTRGSAQRSPQQRWRPHRPDEQQPTTTTRRAAAVDSSPPPRVGAAPLLAAPGRGLAHTNISTRPGGVPSCGGAGPRPDASRLRGGPLYVRGLVTAAAHNSWARHSQDRHPPMVGARCAVRRFRNVGAACLRVCGEHSRRGHANGMPVVMSRVGSRHRWAALPGDPAVGGWGVACRLWAALWAAVVDCPGWGAPGGRWQHVVGSWQSTAGDGDRMRAGAAKPRPVAGQCTRGTSAGGQQQWAAGSGQQAVDSRQQPPRGAGRQQPPHGQPAAPPTNPPTITNTPGPAQAGGAPATPHRGSAKPCPYQPRTQPGRPRHQTPTTRRTPRQWAARQCTASAVEGDRAVSGPGSRKHQ